jgi:hypothetical protein
MLAFDDGKPADAGADKNSGPFRNIRRNGQIGLLHRKLRGGYRVMNEEVHLLEVFLLEPPKRIEIPNLRSNPRGKLRGVKPRNGPTPLRPSHRPFQVCSVPVPSAVTRPTPVTTTRLFSKCPSRVYDFGRCASI